MKNINLVMFFIWLFGIVFGWLCSNWFADLRCQKSWEKWMTPKYENNLLNLIDWYRQSREHVTKAGNKIIKIICDSIRDIIPDIEGWVGSIDSPDVLIFSSSIQVAVWEREIKENGIGGRNEERWRSLGSLIGEVFPELKFRVDDNGMYMPPEKQKIIIERLQQLRSKNDKQK